MGTVLPLFFLPGRSVAQRLRTARGRAGGGKGSPPPVMGVRGSTPEHLFAFSFASGDFWCISIGETSVIKFEILSSSHKWINQLLYVSNYCCCTVIFKMNIQTICVNRWIVLIGRTYITGTSTVRRATSCSALTWWIAAHLDKQRPSPYTAMIDNLEDFESWSSFKLLLVLPVSAVWSSCSLALLLKMLKSN